MLNGLLQGHLTVRSRRARHSKRLVGTDTHRIGLRENLQENPIFDGKIPWFPVDFPLNQSIEIHI